MRPSLPFIALLLAAPSLSAQVRGDLCHRPIPLLEGSTVRGSTADQPDRAHASCGNQALSGERVYALHLNQASHVALRVAADYDVAVYVRRDCRDEVSEVACNDDLEDSRHAGINVDLNAGTWFVFVDGYDTDSEGNYTLTVSTRPMGPRIAPRRP